MNDNKLEEIKKLLNKKVNIDVESKISYLKKKFKEALKDFTYISDYKFFLKNKKFYVRYVGFNDIINYGGFFLKAEKKNNNVIIFLINKDKKVWQVDFNRNYVFINNILSNDEKMRKTFEEYLKSLN
jgi:hypothetical protein